MTFANRTETTAGDLPIEGARENRRNRDSKDLFKAILLEVFGSQMPDPDDLMIAHHLTVVTRGKADDHGHQFELEIVQEFPSADTLIFDHTVAKKLWGQDWRMNLTGLATEPVETRDALLAKLYYGRK